MAILGDNFFTLTVSKSASAISLSNFRQLFNFWMLPRMESIVGGLSSNGSRHSSRNFSKGPW